MDFAVSRSVFPKFDPRNPRGPQRYFQRALISELLPAYIEKYSIKIPSNNGEKL